VTEITWVLTDILGLHARPAGQLVKLAASFNSKICIGTRKKMVDAKRVIGVMGLILKQGSEITMSFDGGDEAAAAAACRDFLEKNL
jgi:phosphocarrier protein